MKETEKHGFVIPINKTKSDFESAASMRSWNPSDVPPDVRALAEESAKRAGLSLSAWLARTIYRQRDIEAAERTDGAQAGTGPAVEMSATNAAPVIHRFLPKPLPGPQDVPVDDIRISSLHSQSGLVQRLGESPTGQASISAADMPIVARPSAQGDGYEIVTGIAHWQAARAAGHRSVPAMIMDLSDHEMIRLILIEILTTARIPLIAEAESLRWLLQRGDVGEDDLTEISGRTRDEIHQRIALLSLPAPVLDRVDDGSLSNESAAVLVSAVHGEAVGRIAVAHALSDADVRALVTLTDALGNGDKRPNIGAIEQEMSMVLGAAVSIDRSDDGTATIRVADGDGQEDKTYSLPATATGNA